MKKKEIIRDVIFVFSLYFTTYCSSSDRELANYVVVTLGTWNSASEFLQYSTVMLVISACFFSFRIATTQGRDVVCDACYPAG